MQTNIEQIVENSFLARVPEIMERGGFTIESAIEQAYQEELVLIARLSDASHSRGANNAYREAVNLMSDRTYQRLREGATMQTITEKHAFYTLDSNAIAQPWALDKCATCGKTRKATCHESPATTEPVHEALNEAGERWNDDYGLDPKAAPAGEPKQTLANLVIADTSEANSGIRLRRALERILEVAKAGATQTKDEDAAIRFAWIMGRARGQLLQFSTTAKSQPVGEQAQPLTMTQQLIVMSKENDILTDANKAAQRKIEVLTEALKAVLSTVVVNDDMSTSYAIDRKVRNQIDAALETK
jgi:predicted RNA-binding Zn ribbon-like protein